MAHVVVIGAGAMGLAAAHRALTQGHAVTVVEAAPEAGGMAAHFDLQGMSIERFYHFICKADAPTFALLEELGIGDKMHWVATSMGYYSNGGLHPWGDPISLLRFPHLTLIEKIRYGLLMFISTKRNSWESLEHTSAKDWITRWCGESVYEKLWRPLFDLKFYQHSGNVSAAWIWTRIRRVGRSRKSLFQEEMGYIEGGSETLVHRLVAAIEAAGGMIRLADPVTKVRVEHGRAVGVETPSGFIAADAVISTVPTPFISKMVPDLPESARAAYDAIENIGVTCLVLRLKKSVSRNFWVNIADPEMPIPGLIEFSNLRPVQGGETVVYVPYYMPVDNPLWNRTDETFVTEAMACLARINPDIRPQDLLAFHVGRLRYAQPVCPANFAKMIPPVQTSIAGLQIADTCFYYPEDRGISEGIRLGRAMADAV
jgi:protoporphyrinogen oxidase